MLWKNTVLGFICLLLGSFASDALATEFILCDACATDSQFETVAIHQAPAQGGTYAFLVGNPSTTQLRYVMVTVSGDGTVPPLGGGSGQSDEYFIAEGASVWATSYSATQGEQAEFGAIVEFSENQYIIAAHPDWAGMDSFHGRQPELTVTYIQAQMAQKNPAWRSEMISPSLIDAITFAVKQYLGKGPTACLVFLNGDSACFQIGATSMAETRYIDGTAQSKDGSPLHELGGVGSGTPLSIIESDGNVGWGSSSSEVWLFCASVDGVIISCWIEII